MDVLQNEFYVVDKKKYKCASVGHLFNAEPYRFYEVLRTTQGVLLFLDDHLDRLIKSVSLLGVDVEQFRSDAEEQLRKLIQHNKNCAGNLKLLCKLHDESYSIVAYYIPHSYPSNRLYETGVNLCTFESERSDPQLKQIHISNEIAEKVSSISESNTVFEVLLVDHNQCITEGRRSNFFLIAENTLYTAPDECVLPGITRKYVLDIARKQGIEVVYKSVRANEIEQYEAAFICGTSPKIMPAHSINAVSFNVKNSLLNIIISTYDGLIQKYIEEHKSF